MINHKYMDIRGLLTFFDDNDNIIKHTKQNVTKQMAMMMMISQ
jgi:hypothetical protein